MRLAIALVGLGLASSPCVDAQTFPEIVSRTAAAQGEWDSVRGKASADGRYVAFATQSAVFDAADTNGLIDVYLKDRQSGAVTRISRAPGGLAGNGNSGWFTFAFDTHPLAISADGQRIAFLSDASNLVGDDTNGRRDAFVHNRVSGVTTLLSRTPGGVPGNGNTTHVAISGDGEFVVFSSLATDLVVSDTNAMLDLFGRDPDTGGVVERLNLVGVSGQMPTGASADRGAKEPSVSHDGRRIAFASETNVGSTDCAGQCTEIWVRDRDAQTSDQVSMSSGLAGTSPGSASMPTISADGRVVAFSSSGVLAPPDTNAGGSWVDVFVRDTAQVLTEHISRSSDDSVANHTGCDGGAVSGDGRFVAFNCSGLFGPDDTMTSPEVYLRDRELQQTLRLAVSTTQQQGNFGSSQSTVTPDGRFVLYAASSNNLVPGDANGRTDVFLTANPFLFDPPSRIGGGDDASEHAALSDDARYLFFETAEALLAGDTNAEVDIYRRDLTTGALERVSVADDEGQIAAGGNEYAVSADGSKIVFIALDDGSVVLKGEPVPRAVGKQAPIAVAFLRNIITGTTQRMGPVGTPSKQPVISKDGNRVAFVTAANGLLPGDSNGMDDVYVADTATGTVMARASAPVSGDSNGASSAPALSDDGDVVVFETEASNLATTGTPDTNNFADILRVNLVLAQRIRVSATPIQQGNGASRAPSVSADGRHVVFASDANNLGGSDANNASDVFVVDATGGVPQLVSSGSTGAGNGGSDLPVISSDGTTIGFSSAASDLVSGDGNAQPDVFVVDRFSRFKRRLARGDGGTQPNGASQQPRLSRDGQRVAFHSLASNLSAADSNGALSDVFVNGPLDPFLVFRSRFE